ncbi:hypothetical protein [Hugenholtzia roseola]|uniref:hypothetical protein n=1 Tax=Hugenholtzia roseola TaxID=1002 RepID=UPI000417FE11|nr:hypothetical protein [Hugenholtzia roseola]
MKAILAGVANSIALLTAQVAFWAILIIVFGFYNPLVAFFSLIPVMLFSYLKSFGYFLKLLKLPNADEEYRRFRNRNKDSTWRMEGVQTDLTLGSLVAFFPLFFGSAFIIFSSGFLYESYELSAHAKISPAVVVEKRTYESRGVKYQLDLEFFCSDEKDATPTLEKLDISSAFYEEVEKGDTLLIRHSTRNCDVLELAY